MLNNSTMSIPLVFQGFKVGTRFFPAGTPVNAFGSMPTGTPIDALAVKPAMKSAMKPVVKPTGVHKKVRFADMVAPSTIF